MPTKAFPQSVPDSNSINLESPFQKIDSSSWWKKKLNFDIEGGNWYLGGAGNANITIPPIIETIRRSSYNGYNPTQALDNPLAHNAFYFMLKCQLEITPDVKLYADLLAEHRGSSYGVFDVNNTVVLPLARVDIKQRILLKPIFKKPFNLALRVGNFRDTRIHEGLMIYNIDAQGLDLNISHGKLHFQYYILSDLLNGIGLGIDDSHDYVLSLKGLGSGSWKTDIRLGYFFGTPIRPRYNGFKFSAGTGSEQSRLYFQIATNTHYGRRDIDQLANYSALIGARHQIDNQRLKIKGVLEMRYYGGLFNERFKNVNEVNYRTSRQTLNYAGTIGSHLYPLYLYDRPFSQWAVFTEYQDTRQSMNIYQQKSVGGITCQLKGRYNPIKNYITSFDVDVNHIIAEDQPAFTYVFLTLGLGIEVLEKNTIQLIVSNKGMNLDLNYPTFYQYKSFLSGFTFQRKL